MSNRVCFDTAENALSTVSEGPITRFYEDWNSFGRASCFDPNFEVRESDDKFKLFVEIPGVEKDDVHIEAGSGILKITGVRKEPELNESDRCFCSGLDYGSFEKRFQLSDSVDDKKIDARFHNGMLELTLSKREEAKRKSIDIKMDSLILEF